MSVAQTVYESCPRSPWPVIKSFASSITIYVVAATLLTTPVAISQGDPFLPVSTFLLFGIMFGW